MGCVLLEGYGMMEVSFVVIINLFDGNGCIGMIGLLIFFIDVCIWDEECNIVCVIGEVGEIQVQGFQVMKGYYNCFDEIVKIICDGWLCIGDMGMMDKEGFVKIVDCKKDMILVLGFNVYFNEIEDVVVSYDKVFEVVVVGILDDKLGEVVKIFVVKKDKSLKEKELIVFCWENLIGYKVFKEVEFRDEFFKMNVGKIFCCVLWEE